MSSTRISLGLSKQARKVLLPAFVLRIETPRVAVADEILGCPLVSRQVYFCRPSVGAGRQIVFECFDHSISTSRLGVTNCSRNLARNVLSSDAHLPTGFHRRAGMTFVANSSMFFATNSRGMSPHDAPDTISPARSCSA